MNKNPQTRYSEAEARARFDKTLNDARRARYGLLKMTATLKRRALKKRPGKPGCVTPPAIQ
jgi:hypothetical protein